MIRKSTTLLSDSVTHYKKYFSLFAPIYLISGVISAVFIFLMSSVERTVSADPLLLDMNQLVLVLVSLLVAVFFSILMSIALMKAVAHPESTTIQNAYAFAFGKFIPYTWVGFLSSLIIVLGFILLIIPGIIFLVWFAFSSLTVLFEDLRGITALQKSKEYVSGMWSVIAFKLLFLVAVSIVVSIVMSIVTGFVEGTFGSAGSSIIQLLLNLVLVPISLTYIYFLYLDVKREKELMTVVPVPASVPTNTPDGNSYSQ